MPGFLRIHTGVDGRLPSDTCDRDADGIRRNRQGIVYSGGQ